MVGAKKKLFYFLLEAFEEKPKRYLMPDSRNYAKIVDKLELRFGVEKYRDLN